MTRGPSSSLCIIWCNKLSDQHRPEKDGSYSVPIIADSLCVSGGLCKTKLRSRNDKASCFRPSDTRLHGRTWQCISFKYVLISPTSFVDAAYQIQLERSFWDRFLELPYTTGNNECSFGLFYNKFMFSLLFSLWRVRFCWKRFYRLFSFYYVDRSNCLTSEFPLTHVTF